jgi:hypothetical protein
MMGTTTGAARHRLNIGIAITTALILGALIADLATGGRPDPPDLRASATLLNGPWRFHTGDDPQWAEAGTNDRDWKTIDLTAPPGSHDGDVGLPDYVDGWMAHGFAGYHGYAWYRREVAVPAGSASWDILGPTQVEDGYEIYWNGKKLGGSGRLGSSPRMVGTRPLQFALPSDAAGTTGVIAIRAYMLPRSGAGTTGGGMHSPPMLAQRPIAQALHGVQWERTIAGYIVDLIEPVGMFALIGLAFWRRPDPSYRGFLIFSSIALALTAFRRLNNAIVAWTDLEDLSAYSWMASVLWAPAVASWILAWNRWCGRPWRCIDISALVLAVVGLIGALSHLPGATRWSRIGSIALFVVLCVRIIRRPRIRALALATIISIMLAWFGSELLDPIHVPGIWFPFGIGVARTQYIYGLVIPLMAFLIAQISPAEER